MIFISYKSEDYKLARKIAEGLIVSGQKVWFAEYRVLDTNWEDFLASIKKGINESVFGICITNNKYLNSDHCMMELEHLINKLGPDNLIEIKNPGSPEIYQSVPLLRNANKIEYIDIRNVFKYFEEIGLIRNIPKRYLDNLIKPQRVKNLKYLDWGISFDSSNWQLVSSGENKKRYLRNVEGVTLYLYVERYILINNDQQEELFRSEGRNDRENFMINLKLIKRFRRRMRFFLTGIKLFGAHLFIVKGYSHLAFTYRFKGLLSLFRKKILRQYVITLPYPLEAKTGEPRETGVIIIKGSIFNFSKSDTLNNFLEYAPLFDNFVESVNEV